MNLNETSMGARKSEVFSDQENELAELAKALGHPARVAILKALAQQNVCVCGQLVDVVPLAQSTVSQHLKELKAAGLIKGTVEGVKSCYCIDWTALAHFRKLLDDFFTPPPGDCSC